MRRRMYKLHKWLGVIAGIPLLMMSFTGSVLLFRPELEQLTLRYAYRVHPGPSKVSIEDQLKSAQKSVPNVVPFVYEIPSAEDRPAKIIFRKSGAIVTVLVNPFSGQALAIQDRQSSWLEMLYQLHSRFLLSTFGEAFVAILGLALVLLVISGMYVHGLKLVVPSRNRRRPWLRPSQLHRLAGIGSLVMLLIWGTSGFWMNHETLFPATQQKTEQYYLPAKPLEYFLLVANSAFPGWSPTALSLPVNGQDRISIDGTAPCSGLCSIFGAYGATVILQADTANVVDIFDPRHASLFQALDRAVYPLHTAYFGKSMYSNVLIRLFYALAGIAPSILAITGFVLWIKRRRFARSLNRAKSS